MGLKTIPRFAVIGSPIQHSVSPRIHEAFSKQMGVPLSYEKIELPKTLSTNALIDFLEDFKQQGGQGVNVTAPFKKVAFDAMDKLADTATLVGAVNTIRFRDGLWEGHNTDTLGCLDDWHRLGVEFKGKRALILGAGGAASGILAALVKENPAAVIIMNRTPERAIRLTEIWAKRYPQIVWTAHPWQKMGEKVEVLINATTRAVDETDFACLDLNWHHIFAYDLNYQVGEKTPFLRFCEKKSVQKMADGIGMLWAQAAHAFFLWHGLMPRWQELL